MKQCSEKDLEKGGAALEEAGDGVEALVRPGERVDDLQRNHYRIIQDPARFCFGMDAVLLSVSGAFKYLTILNPWEGIPPITLLPKNTSRPSAALASPLQISSRKLCFS